MAVAEEIIAHTVQLFRSFQSPSFPMLALIRHRIYMNRTHGARVMNDWWGRWNESRVNKRRFTAVKDVSWGPYTSPEVYDIAFSYRDFESEVSFLMEAYSMHTQLPLQRYLDIGCGPARHAMLLAQAAGIECIGIDSSEEMIHYARQRAQEYGIAEHVRLMQGDMKSCQGFKEIITCGSVNLAVIMIGTLSHCLTNDHALQCLKNVAE